MGSYVSKNVKNSSNSETTQSQAKAGAGTGTGSIDHLVKSRKDARQRNTKKRIDGQLKAIEARARVKASSLLPTRPRPYGLPTEMEGQRRPVWKLILERVNDLDSIVNLREVCRMFDKLLERKYVAAILPQIMWNYVENKGLQTLAEKKSWLKTLSNLRSLSKASKNTIDRLIHQGMIGRDGTKYFLIAPPHFLIKKEVPMLKVGASEIAQERLQKTLKRLRRVSNPAEHFPLSAVMLNELHDYGVQVNLLNLRDSFEILSERIGVNITSFLYRTEEKSIDTYENLRRWVAFMPNLKDLIVDLKGPILLRSWEVTGTIKLKPFPKGQSLKRFVEGPKGFGVPFLNEIIRANPSIQEVILGEREFKDEELENVRNALNTLHLTKFHTICIPNELFFKKPLRWHLQLTTLALWDSSSTENGGDGISSKLLFIFISSCVNLVDLMLSTPCIKETGGYLKLPKLEYFAWKVFPTFKSMEFLKFAGNLECLSLDLSVCPDDGEDDEVMQFLGEWNIPSLFPGLMRIRIRTWTVRPYKTIWSRD